MAAAARVLIREAVLGAAYLCRGRTGPALAGLDLLRTRHGGSGLDVGIVANARARQQRGARADAGVLAHLDGTHAQNVAVEPVAAEIDLRLDGRVRADGEQARDRRQRVEIDAVADLHAEGARVVIDPRRTRDGPRTGRVGPAFRRPDA